MVKIHEVFTQDADGSLIVEIAGNSRGGTYDHLSIYGSAQIEGTIELIFTEAFAPAEGDVFKLISANGSLDLSNALFEIKNLHDDFLYKMSVTDGNLKMTALNDATVVPEPSSLVLFLSLAAMDGLRRRDKKGSGVYSASVGSPRLSGSTALACSGVSDATKQAR